jgi:2-iminobutanoate/2-iminopropanoate deaminase
MTDGLKSLKEVEQSMKKEIINVPDIKKSDSPFNHIIKAGNTLYLTSQLSCDLKTGEIIPGDIEIQTKNALDNIKYLLESAESSLENVVKVIIYMRNVSDFNKMNQVYRKYFKEGEEPTRVTIQAMSPIDGIDIEMEVTALTN